MTRARRWIEWGKDLLIVGLLLSAAVLLRYSGFVAPLAERMDAAADTQSGNSALSYDPEEGLEQARPAAVAVSGGSGGLYAAAYDAAAVEEVFSDFSAALGEALGSASMAKAVTEEEWRDALLGQGVYFDYDYPQPLSLLSAWLGTAAGRAGDYSVRRLLLSLGEEQVTLYFQEAGDEGGFYRCTTAVSAATVSQRAAAYRQTNASFAFVNEKMRGAEPYMTVLQELPTLYRAESAPAADNGFDLEKLMGLMGMNSYVTKQYTEADGTRVYVENGRSLRIDAAGHISCKSAAAVASADSADLVGAVRAAFAFVQTAVGGSAGDGELRFAAVENVGEDSYVVRFQYSLDGVAVELPDGGMAATVTVRRGAVTQAELTPRLYRLTGEACVLLPVSLAAAAAAATGGSLRLLYLDAGSSAECMWVG